MPTVFVYSAASGANDGTSWTDAYTSLNTALAAISASDLVLVSGTFNETVAMGAAGTVSAPTVIQGDDRSGGSVVGNAETFTIDGQSTRSNGMTDSARSAYTTIKNMRITGCTSIGFSGSGVDKLTFKDCRFDNNGSWGCQLDNEVSMLRCQFDNNSANGGGDWDNFSTAIGCISFSNTGIGFSSNSCTYYGCLSYNNTGNGIQMATVGNNNYGCIINCTIDAENASVNGIDLTNSIGTVSIVNTIVYDSATGIAATNDQGERFIATNNLFNSNTTDYPTNFPSENEVTSAPSFTNESSDDYTLQASSPAQAAGMDAGDLVNDVSYVDIGAHQRQEPAGGGTTIITRPRRVM